MNGAHVAVLAEARPATSAAWGVFRRNAASGLVSTTCALNNIPRVYHGSVTAENAGGWA